MYYVMMETNILYRSKKTNQTKHYNTLLRHFNKQSKF